MNLLLDTQIFIWAFGYPHKLPERISEVIRDPKNQKLLSVAAVWEMQLKTQIGKLTLPMKTRDFVETNVKINKIQLLPILNRHVWTLDQMPLHHRDPFDRIIIAQAITQNLTLVSVDSNFPLYNVNLLN